MLRDAGDESGDARAEVSCRAGGIDDGGEHNGTAVIQCHSAAQARGQLASHALVAAPARGTAHADGAADDASPGAVNLAVVATAPPLLVYAPLTARDLSVLAFFAAFRSLTQARAMVRRYGRRCGASLRQAGLS